METEFPLSHPDGVSVASLPWGGQDTARCGGDRGWIVEASTGGSATATWSFGKPSFGRHLCLHRFKLWWLKPSHGHSGHDLPPESSMLLAERHPSVDNTPDANSMREYVALLPLSDTHASSSLHRLGSAAATSEARATNESLPAPRTQPAVTADAAAVLPVPAAVPSAQLTGAAGAAGAAASVAPSPSSLALTATTGDAATPLPDILGVMLVAVGVDPFRLVRRLVHESTERIRAQLGASDGEATGAATGGTEDKGGAAAAASFVDKFGWCTWDSFYTMVTPEGVLKGLSTLHECGVKPRWVVIDDGWQLTTNDDALNGEQWDERLVGLEANKRFRRFDEEGRLVLELGDTVSEMKRKFGVDKVLAWHAMAGYWAGVDPEATKVARFDPRVTKLLAPKGIREADPKMQPELDGKRFGMVPAARMGEFYLAYHRYLKDNGVDGVKVDAQSILDCMGGGNGGVPSVTRAYHEGLSRSVQDTFKERDKPAALIHCMCHAPSVLSHIASTSKDRAVVRGSDDFYPRDDSSHGLHLYTNAFNAVLLSNLGVQDWDMFQTGLGLQGADGPLAAGAGVAAGGARASWLHAAARAISGGPVYVSDRPGQHNVDILAKLVLDDGSVLRARTNALPTLDCLMTSPQEEGGGLLKTWSLNAVPGTGIVGSFNIRGTCADLSEGHSIKGAVSPSDVHAFNDVNTLTDYSQAIEPTTSGVRDGDDEAPLEEVYAVYLHCRGEVRVVAVHQAIDIELPPLCYELATFSKVVQLARSGAKSTAGGKEPVRWAPLGLPDKFNSCGAVSKQEMRIIPGNKGVLREEDAACRERDGTSEVALSVKGSGKFFAVASRCPTRVTICAGRVGADGCTTDDEGVTSDVAGGEAGGGDIRVLELSFSELPELLASGGGRGLGLVEVCIPGPWGKRERWLSFWWD